MSSYFCKQIQKTISAKIRKKTKSKIKLRKNDDTSNTIPEREAEKA